MNCIFIPCSSYHSISDNRASRMTATIHLRFIYISTLKFEPTKDQLQDIPFQRGGTHAVEFPCPRPNLDHWVFGHRLCNAARTECLGCIRQSCGAAYRLRLGPPPRLETSPSLETPSRVETSPPLEAASLGIPPTAMLPARTVPVSLIQRPRATQAIQSSGDDQSCRVRIDRL